MKLLLVGALAWNPERIRSLREQGHELFGLWSRSMAWDQGPYPTVEDCVRTVALEDAARTIREERIDCIYSLFQVYHRRLWAPSRPGVEHGIWTLLRTLLAERARGAFDAPIVRHWGFDLHNLDPDVVRSLDGHIFCNRQKHDYLTLPRSQGGRGLSLLDECEVVGVLDGDRPKLEFMHSRFAAALSDQQGETHTVCVGRPFNIDYLGAARRGIHIHVYSNGFDEALRTIARDLSPRQASANAKLLGRYVHVHDSLQTIGASWPRTREVKSRWVEEFSRYDAAWSYIGSPLPWEPLDDRGAIPNRLGTYLLAGLPVITDRRPGSWRYEELHRLGVGIELEDHDYDGLRRSLETEIATRSKRDCARQRRDEYAFEATIDALLETLDLSRQCYFAKSPRERTAFRPSRRMSLIHFNTSPRLRSPQPGDRFRREAWRRLLLPWKTRLLRRVLP
jgi:hypothetical protein